MSTPKNKLPLVGSIDQFNLSDIVQFLSGSAKTGLLRMKASSTGDEGAIFFVDGSVVHAETGGSNARVGEDAFFDLMLWNEGDFGFEPGVEPGDKTVRQSSTNLLLEGARRKDEWSILSKHIPDMGLVPEFVLPGDNETGQQITLNTSEWVVLSKIDGRRSLKEVAEAASISDYDTCRLIYPLLANRLIRLRTRREH